MQEIQRKSERTTKDTTRLRQVKLDLDNKSKRKQRTRK